MPHATDAASRADLFRELAAVVDADALQIMAEGHYAAMRLQEGSAAGLPRTALHALARYRAGEAERLAMLASRLRATAAAPAVLPGQNGSHDSGVS